MKKYKWIIVSITAVLLLWVVGIFFGSSKQELFELKCIYPDSNAHYDFILKDRNTAEDFKHGFPVTAKERGTPVTCQDVIEYSNKDKTTLKILLEKPYIATALMHNPLGGVNYQIEYMTLGGDVVGYSCIYFDMRYDCFTDEPFIGCPQALADAKSILAPKCKYKEIK